jgi:hypothetical protein
MDPAVIVEGRLGRALRTITLSNGLLEAVLLPDKGADVYALRSLPHGVDVLWKAPWGQRAPGTVLAAAPNSEVAWMEYYGGGWQDILPSGGGPCTYMGVELPFHGEVASLPWHDETVIAGPGRAEVRLTVRTHRLPLAVERVFGVERGRPALYLAERIINEGGEEIDLMWGQHLAFGAPFLSGSCWLDVPAGTFLVHDPALGPASRLRGGDRFAWPDGARDRHGQPLELRQIPPPSAQVADYGYLLDLREGWYTLHNRDLGLGVRVTWPHEVFSCVWLWQELCGSAGYPWYRRCYVMGVEPFTSYPGTGLVDALAQGTARRLAPGASLAAQMTVEFYT